MSSYGVLGDFDGEHVEGIVHPRGLTVLVEDRSYLYWMTGLYACGLRVQHVEVSVVALLQLSVPLLGLLVLPCLFLFAEGHETEPLLLAIKHSGLSCFLQLGPFSSEHLVVEHLLLLGFASLDCCHRLLHDRLPLLLGGLRYLERLLVLELRLGLSLWLLLGPLLSLLLLLGLSRYLLLHAL